MLTPVSKDLQHDQSKYLKHPLTFILLF